jgi:signal transduction histidine kinase
MTNIHLLVHNIVSIVSALATIGVALFLFLKKERSVASNAFAGTFLAGAVFTISHIIGVNAGDPYFSQTAFLFNCSVFFVAAFNTHAILAITNKDRELRWVLIAMYSAAVVFSILYFIFPNLFFVLSVKKMYFPYYYEPGPLNFLRIVYIFLIFLPFALYELGLAYRKAISSKEKNQFKYLIFTIAFGYMVAFIPNLLIFDIQVDPLWGMGFGVFAAVPLMYGAIKYELFDVRVIAKQSVLYASSIAIVGGLITFINYASEWIHSINSSFPNWIVPIVSSLLVVTTTVIVWRRLRENDVLKYEFITTVTHKFRTPLTHIKWASENLGKDEISKEDSKQQLSYIANANTKLVELTNLLVNASETENTVFDYNLKKADLALVIDEVLVYVNDQAKAKNIIIEKNIPSRTYALIDSARIHFVIQTLIENAIQYSQGPGTIELSLAKESSNVIFRVHDKGIGISPEEINLLFAKFYRGKQARLADTEGLGIGLFISREIITKHNGKIWVESDGAGKGSTFAFSVKAA